MQSDYQHEVHRHSADRETPIAVFKDRESAFDFARDYAAENACHMAVVTHLAPWEDDHDF